MMVKRTSVACLLAPLMLASCACPQPPSPQALPLDQVPVEQLRAMLKGHMGDWRNDTDQSKGLPAPPTQKPVPKDAPRIELVAPDAFSMGTLPLAEAIGRRRSRRMFGADTLTLGEVSFLAWCTQGVTGTVPDGDDGAGQTFRTVPSGGGRHPFETYLLVNRVDGVPPGIYRYLPLEHELVTVRRMDGVAAAARAACYGQSFVGDAAVVFVWTAVPYRTEWKYAYIAHRMIAMEAGHVCQNLYLAVEAIGAGACALLGYDQARMDNLVGVDGREEFTIYLACVGRRAGE